MNIHYYNAPQIYINNVCAFYCLDFLKEPLDRYMKKLSKVRILRTEKREGLIRCRLMGYKVARAPVLVFLDSHIECFPGTETFHRKQKHPTPKSTPPPPPPQPSTTKKKKRKRKANKQNKQTNKKPITITKQSRSSQCSTTGVTKAVVCGMVHIKEPMLLIDKMWRQRVSFLTIRMVLNHMSDAIQP